MAVFAAFSLRRVSGSLRSTVMSLFAAIRNAVFTAGPEREIAFLVFKTVVATVLSWQFAVHVLDSPTPYYAPLAALLVVDRTLVRSLWSSAQTLVAIIAGMSVAWVVGAIAGVQWWSMALVVLVAVLIARWRAFGSHGLQVPTMAILSLLTVGGTNGTFTFLTIVETMVGGVIGVATNAIVVAPLHVTQSREAVSSFTSGVHELLTDISRGLRADWDEQMAIDWGRSSQEIIRTAPVVSEKVAHGRESIQFNPRNRLRKVQVDWAGYARTVEAMLRTQWHVSSIARTLADVAGQKPPRPSPSPTFLSAYADALADISSAVSQFGRDGDGEQTSMKGHLERASETLDDLEERLRHSPLTDPRAWPAYGALLIDAQRMVSELSTTHEEAAVPTESTPVRGRIQWRAES